MLNVIIHSDMIGDLHSERCSLQHKTYEKNKNDDNTQPSPLLFELVMLLVGLPVSLPISVKVTIPKDIRDSHDGSC